MPKINTFSRDAKIYQTIELYKPYEFTYTCCYEMAVRNKKVISLLEQMEKISSKVKDLALPIDNNEYSSLSSLIQKEFYFSLTEKDLFHNRYLFIDLEFPNAQESIEHIASRKYTKFIFNGPIDKKRVPFVPNNKSRRESMYIDLALPKAEILATVTEIKKAYDTLHQLTTSSLEEVLIDESLYKLRITLKNSKELKSIIYPSKTKQHLIADIFFIYDKITANSGIKDDNIIADIQNELLDYYTNFIMDSNKLSKENRNKLEITIYNLTFAPKSKHFLSNIL